MKMLALTMLASAVGATASIAAAAPPETTVIHAGHLIVEAGRPVLQNQSIVIENGKVKEIKSGFVAGTTVIELRDSWVMPGLIDMHTHVSGELNLDEPTAGQIALAYLGRKDEQVLSELPRVNALLMGGFTSIRNVGDPTGTTYALRDAINRGDVAGPRMFAIEPQISMDGGDFDASQWRVLAEVEKYVEGRGNCTGVVECTKVVRKEINRGADVIKLRQSSQTTFDPKVKMIESEDEIKAVINTAHKLDRKVAVHVNGSPEFLHMVIADGADTIEHGPLDDESIALMKQHGTAFTPTLLAAKLVMPELLSVALEGAGKAYRAGVPIIFGTDLGIFGTKRSHEEFGLLAEAGLPPAQVLRAATMNAATALGRGDSLGSIADGKLADVIAMKSDPYAKIDQLGDPEKISFVMKEGRVYKDRR